MDTEIYSETATFMQMFPQSVFDMYITVTTRFLKMSRFHVVHMNKTACFPHMR